MVQGLSKLRSWPQIQVYPYDTMHPFTFRWRQYPLWGFYAMTINKCQCKVWIIAFNLWIHSWTVIRSAIASYNTGGLKYLTIPQIQTVQMGVTNIVYTEIFKDPRDTKLRIKLFYWHTMFELAMFYNIEYTPINRREIHKCKFDENYDLNK